MGSTGTKHSSMATVSAATRRMNVYINPMAFIISGDKRALLEVDCQITGMKRYATMERYYPTVTKGLFKEGPLPARFYDDLPRTAKVDAAFLDTKVPPYFLVKITGLFHVSVIEKCRAKCEDKQLWQLPVSDIIVGKLAADKPSKASVARVHISDADNHDLCRELEPCPGMWIKLMGTPLDYLKLKVTNASSSDAKEEMKHSLPEHIDFSLCSIVQPLYTVEKQYGGELNFPAFGISESPSINECWWFKSLEIVGTGIEAEKQVMVNSTMLHSVNALHAGGRRATCQLNSAYEMANPRAAVVE